MQERTRGTEQPDEATHTASLNAKPPTHPHLISLPGFLLSFPSLFFPFLHLVLLLSYFLPPFLTLFILTPPEFLLLLLLLSRATPHGMSLLRRRLTPVYVTEACIYRM